MNLSPIYLLSWTIIIFQPINDYLCFTFWAMHLTDSITMPLNKSVNYIPATRTIHNFLFIIFKSNITLFVPNYFFKQFFSSF